MRQVKLSLSEVVVLIAEPGAGAHTVHTDVTSHVAVCKRTGERTAVNLSDPGEHEYQAHLHHHQNIEKIVLIAAQDMQDGLGHSTLQLGTPDLHQAGKLAIGGVKDPSR